MPDLKDLPRWALPSVLGGFLFLYLLCAAPGITWEDSASYHLRSTQGDATETYRPYPLHQALLKTAAAVPLGPVAWRLNALHAILSTACLGLLFLLVRRLSGSPRAGICAVLCLGFSHLFWHYAEVTKVYPLMNLLLLASFLGLASASSQRLGPLILSGAAFGLSLGTHPFVGAALPGIAAWLFWGWRSRPFGAAGRWLFGLLLGTAATLPLYWSALEALGPVEFARHWAFAGHGEDRRGFFRNSDSPGTGCRRTAEWALFSCTSSGNVADSRGARECMGANPAAGRALPILYACYVLVPFDFNVSLKINFYLPSFLLAAVWCGIGLDSRFPKGGKWAFPRAAFLLAAVSPILYAIAVFGYCESTRPRRLFPPWDASYKNRARFYLWPPKAGFDEPLRHARAVRSIIEPEAIVVVDFQEMDVLRYYQREGILPVGLNILHIQPWKDPGIFRAEVLAAWRGEPLYFGRIYRPYWKDSGWIFREAGPLDRVTLPFTLESVRQVVARHPSPDGRVDAVVVATRAGPAAPDVHQVFLAPPGEDGRARQPVITLYAATRGSGEAGVSVRWDGPRAVSVGYREARSVAVPSLRPRVGALEILLLSHREEEPD